jgi:hypothetical protein
MEKIFVKIVIITEIVEVLHFINTVLHSVITFLRFINLLL